MTRKQKIKVARPKAPVTKKKTTAKKTSTKKKKTPADIAGNLYEKTPYSYSITGILQPALAHRWAIDTSLPEDLNNLLQRCAIRCAFNLVDNTFTLVIEQPLTSNDTMFRMIRLLKNRTPITVSFLDGDVGVGSFISFDAKLIKHELKLDYALSEAVTHYLEFEDVRMFG